VLTTDATTVFESPLLDEDAEDLYENAPCGYASTLPDGTMVKVNRTFLSWTGFSRAELLGRTLQSLMTHPGRIYYETHCAPLLYMQGSLKEVALDLLCRGGQKLPTFVNWSVKRDRQAQPVLFRVTVFNASDRRQYERELLLARRAAEREAQAKAMLLKMLSHDLRTPLTSFSLAIGLLEERGLPPAQAELVEVLKTSAQNLLGLVNTILDFSRLEAGQLKLVSRPVELRPLIERTVGPLRMQLRGHPVTLTVSVDDRLPRAVVLDASAFGQVLTNLLGNAIKFTGQGGIQLRLELMELTRDGVDLEVSVSDTGMGISADRLDAIFDEFTQASPDVRASHGGTGLGLAICRRLLRLFNSDLTVSSQPGQGSIFSFRLKVPVAHPPAAHH
jgi:PAS domain S-box-containing protein